MSKSSSDEGLLSMVTQLPCLKTAVIAGVSGGVGATLVHFFFSSNIRKAQLFGIASYGAVFFASWTFCYVGLKATQASNLDFEKQVERRVQEKAAHKLQLENPTSDTTRK